MSGHTPGPWNLEGHDIKGAIRQAGMHGLLSQVVATVPRMQGDAEANARLIASAPDLLEALKAMVALFHSGCENTLAAIVELEAAEAVLAKAGAL